MKRIVTNLICGIASGAILVGLPAVSLSQSRLPETPKPKAPVVRPFPPAPVDWYRDSSEKSIKVDSAISLRLCVSEGTVRVNGWSRNEIRVYVEDGSKFTFNVREKSEKSGDPNWIDVVNVGDTKRKFGPASECLMASEIEIDVPMGASVTLKGHEATTKVDSVKKVDIQTLGGDITLRNIVGGIKASGGQGDVMVETSSGPMELVTASGNIVVFDARPIEIGEPFKAKTNGGTISLQDLLHRQVDVNSISGSVMYNGVIRSGGSYSLSTSKGSIRMIIPVNSSCTVSATYGSGSFETELPIDIVTENKHEGPIKTIVGKYGKGGDATLKLTTTNGSISVRKL